MGKRSFVLLVLLVCACCWGLAVGEGNGAVYTQVRELIATKSEQALLAAQELLVGLYERNPGNTETLLLLAEVHFHLGGLRYEERIQLWKQGELYAREALAVDPDLADAHYWVATSLGRVGEAQGILKSLFMVTPMLKHLERTLELDPKHSWAYFILSQMYTHLPQKPIGRGDLALALQYAKEAYLLEPAEAEFVLQYARLLVRQKNQEQAREMLEDALTSSWILWTDLLHAEALELLDEIIE